MRAIDQLLRYARHSALVESEGRPSLQLYGSKPATEHLPFFQGELNHPLQASRCLCSLALLVGTRYFTPPAMLTKILRESDPVVTVSRNVLRFEGFSACGSVYGRIDILSDGFKTSKMAPGTTNVDFQSEMRAALTTVRNNSKMSLSVSSHEFELTHNQNTIIEKKVKLPLRWLKGFSEVQSSQKSMTSVFNIDRNEAIKFFRYLPRGGSKHPAWVVAAGRGLRLSYHQVNRCVQVMGLERLGVLSDLVQYAQQLSIYADLNNNISAWVLSFKDMRFTLVLSEETWRGFSGEGRLLKDMALNSSQLVLNKVKAALNWQQSISVSELAQTLNETPSSINVALSLLASAGLVGFDVHTQKHFHRVLPFDVTKIENSHPRIISARKLVSSGSVCITHNPIPQLHNASIHGEVTGNGVTHRVELSADGDKCTCPWFAKHQTDRGPCKHILALSIALEDSSLLKH